jgi:hypothetical protein
MNIAAAPDQAEALVGAAAVDPDIRQPTVVQPGLISAVPLTAPGRFIAIRLPSGGRIGPSVSVDQPLLRSDIKLTA